MVLEQQLATLLAEIVDNGLLDPSTSDPHEIASFYGRSPDDEMLTIQTNQAGEQLIDQLTVLLHAELIASYNLRVEEVRDEVVTTVVHAAVAKDQSRLDAPALIHRLIERLRSDEDIWSVLWPIPSLTIPEGDVLDLAGFSFSTLSEAEVTDVRVEHERIAQTMRIGEHGEPGSALPHMRDIFDTAINSSVCWARGTVRARTASVDRIAAEEIRIALAVLRTFALYVGINPDDTLLNVPAKSNIRRAILYRPGAELSFPSAHYERRIPFIMSPEKIERLQRFDLFQRAQAIAASDHPTQLEQKILLAMLQFDTAATLDPPESKLPHYLTVIETLLAREEGERRDRGKKAARRLSAFATSDSERTRLRATSKNLYDLRTGPIHHGSRGLRGNDVVTKRAVEQARLLAYFAILLALQRSSSYKTSEDLITALDVETM